LVKDIDPSGGSAPGSLTDVGGSLFVSAFDGVDDGLTHGRELWRSEGTDATTTLVKDINPSSNSSPDQLTAFGPLLLFAADDGTAGVEPWRSDGTADGTFMLADIWAGANSSFPQSFTPSGGTAFFVASNGLGFGGAPGRELWRTDGTPTGTAMVKDINPTGNSNPAQLTDVGGTLFFVADDGTHGRELWRSDGTSSGTFMVKDINPTGSSISTLTPSSLTDVNGTLFLAADDGTSGTEMWRSDGTSSGTFMVGDINPTARLGSFPREFTAVGSGIFFIASDGGSAGLELWHTDGTPAGTAMVKDINPSTSSDPAELTALGGTLLLRADDGTHGEELWRSDGTGNGTLMVSDINRAGPSFPLDLTVLDGALYFAANDGFHGPELWSSEGTAAGTRPVADINPSFGSFPHGLTVIGETLFFAADDGTKGDELWKASPAGPPAGDNTSTDLSCTPRTVTVGGSTTCLATVNDTSAASNPSGTVTFASDKPGTFHPADQCTLAPDPDAANASTCQIRYSANANGTHTLTSTFTAQTPGEYLTSRGADTIAVTAHRTAACQGRTATRLGTSRPDTLAGTPAGDVFRLFAGNDRARGRGGADAICGGRGRDILRGGKGRDALRGGKGADRLRGGARKDTLIGGRGPDLLIGGPGPDLLIGGKGKDRCIGGPGKDVLRHC